MGKQPEQECLQKVLKLSQEMINLAGSDTELQLDVGCRIVFGALRDHGYVLQKMARQELTALGVLDSSPDPGAAFPTSPLSTAEDPRTVLLVDDDADFLKYLTLLFEDNGFNTLVATNGLEAMEMAASKKPDLITLDITMPEKSGVSTYKDLKSDPDLSSVPVILITAFGEPFNEFIKRRRQVPDPEGFIAKPIDTELLWKTVQEALEGVSTRG